MCLLSCPHRSCHLGKYVCVDISLFGYSMTWCWYTFQGRHDWDLRGHLPSLPTFEFGQVGIDDIRVDLSLPLSLSLLMVCKYGGIWDSVPGLNARQINGKVNSKTPVPP